MALLILFPLLGLGVLLAVMGAAFAGPDSAVHFEEQVEELALAA